MGRHAQLKPEGDGMRDWVILWSAIAICAGISGCLSPKQLYPGSARPASETGVLKLVTNGAITKIAGRELEGTSYSLLPGVYPFNFRMIVRAEEFYEVFRGNDQRVIGQCEGSVEIEAGHEYRITRSRVEMFVDQEGTKTKASGDTEFNYELPIFLVDYGPHGDPVSLVPLVCIWPRMEFKL